MDLLALAEEIQIRKHELLLSNSPHQVAALHMLIGLQDGGDRLVQPHATSEGGLQRRPGVGRRLAYK